MRKTAIFMSILAIIALLATAYLGISVRKGGTEQLRNAHFHAACTMLLISLAAHGLSLSQLFKASDPKPEAAS